LLVERAIGVPHRPGRRAERDVAGGQGVGREPPPVVARAVAGGRFYEGLATRSGGRSGDPLVLGH
jgi:hypothetical protein